MSITSCIASIIKNGKVQPDVAAQLETKVQNFKKRNNITEDTAAVEKFAKEQQDILVREAASAQKYVTLKKKLSGPDSARDLRALLEFDYTGKFKYDADVPSDVWTLSKSYSGYYSRDLIGMMEQFRSKIPGGLDFKLGARIRDIRELSKAIYGESIQNADIALMAKNYSAANKAISAQLRSLGAPAKYAEHWMPQNWDKTLVEKAGEKEFVDHMFNALDMSKTHGGFTDEVEFRAYLSDTYHDIVTNGLYTAVKEDAIRVTQAKGAGGSGLFRERSLQFKDADAFLNAHDRFGQGDIFENMIKSIDNASRELALVRTFGPDYTGTFARLNNQAKMEGGLKALNAATVSNDSIFRYLTGNPEGEASLGTESVANFMAAARSLRLAASLGTSFISSMTDFGTTIQASRLVGASFPKVVKEYLKLFVGNKEARAQAAAMGNVIDSIVTGSLSAAKLVDTSDGSKFGQFATRASEAVLRVSGLTRHTQAIKNAFQVSMNIEYAAHAKLSFDELPKAQKNWLKVNGFTSKDWDVVRAAAQKGKEAFIEPGKISDLTVMEKWLSSINAATRIAIPEPAAYAHTLLGAAQTRGTFNRELRSTLGQLQSYTISLTHVQGKLLMNNTLLATKGSKIGHTVAYALYALPFAILATQLKSIVSGRDMRSFEDPKLFAEAAMQITGLPGDILQRYVQSEGAKDIAASYLGPVPGMAFSTLYNLNAATQGLIEGDTDEARSKGFALINELKKGLVPGQNLWYTKLAVDRLVFDQLQKLADPHANQAFRRSQKNLRNKTGQEFWWERGELTPERPPGIAPAP